MAQGAETSASRSLPRRVGILVRHRARLGLWPGQVSTAGLVQARRLRWSMYLAVPFFLIFLVVPFAVATSKPTESPATVVAVLGSDSTAADGRFRVFLDTGDALFFDRDPGARTGDLVRVRHRGSSAPLGIVVNGEYKPSRPDNNSPAIGVAFFALFDALIGLIIIPSAIWGRRTYKQINADLNVPVTTSRGRYLGSWTWRGLTSSTWNTHRSLGHLRGIPVAIEQTPGQVTWYGAPIERLTELRHFESAIAAGSKDVTITFHPNTRAIARLEATDGRAAVELSRPVDELHPETGLSLKFSRRRRHRHLPDR